MWTLEILLSMVALIALVASESDPDSYAARRTQGLLVLLLEQFCVVSDVIDMLLTKLAIYHNERIF